MNSSSISDHSDSDDSSVAVAISTSIQSKHPARKRRRSRTRATYHVRKVNCDSLADRHPEPDMELVLTIKDEIQILQTRMEELELELKALRFQALVPRSESADRDTTEIPTRAKSSLTRHLLKDAVQSQQFALAGLQAMLSKYSSLQEISPLHAAIRLPAAFIKRRELLLAARKDLLRDSTCFIKERSQGMDPLKAFNEQERFETAGGDFCVTNFEILPLPSRDTASISVKSVFEALYFSICNVEITFSEWMGHITIRENDDESLESQFSQHRLVATAAPTAVQVETNVVAFSEFQSRDNTSDDGIGIIVVDSIDDDELYPYQPNERVRRDTFGVFTLQRHSNSDGEGEQSSAVVLTRWSLSKMYASKLLDEDLSVMREVRASLGTWGEKLVQSLFETALRASKSQGSIVAGDGDAEPEPLVFVSVV